DMIRTLSAAAQGKQRSLFVYSTAFDQGSLDPDLRDAERFIRKDDQDVTSLGLLYTRIDPLVTGLPVEPEPHMEWIVAEAKAHRTFLRMVRQLHDLIRQTAYPST